MPCAYVVFGLITPLIKPGRLSYSRNPVGSDEIIQAYVSAEHLHIFQHSRWEQSFFPEDGINAVITFAIKRSECLDPGAIIVAMSDF
jgi:hypothetical protein